MLHARIEVRVERYFFFAAFALTFGAALARATAFAFGLAAVFGVGFDFAVASFERPVLAETT